MKNYRVSRQNIKQSAKNLGQFFKDQNIAISHSTILSGLSKVFFFKNWNALEASLDDVSSLQPECELEEMILCLKTNHHPKTIRKLIDQKAKEANCHLEIIQYQSLESCDEIKIRVTLVNGMSNFSTFIFLLAETIKALSWDIEVFHYWRISCKQENLMAALPLIQPRTRI